MPRLKSIFGLWSLIFSLIFVFWSSAFGLSSAQTRPEFLITWRASNYAPSDFAGKILPIPGSALTAALELIDGGRIADLSQTEIRWSVNNKIGRSGKGIKTFGFLIDQFEREDQLVTAEIINYKNANLSKTIIVPLGRSETTIKKIGRDLFAALPYFFNVARPEQLIYRWRVNNQVPEGSPANPWKLSLDTNPLPEGLSVNVSVEVVNTLNELEQAIGNHSFVTIRI